MDVVKAVETYITKMVSIPPSMKVLLLDNHTTPIVSLSATQSTLLSHQVYLTDKIDNKKRDRMAHMKCVCFLQPSDESFEALAAELKEPKYGEYYLYFSNILSKTAIERLADVDEYEVVREVQEYFADYAPILPCLFTLNHIPTASHPLYGNSPNSWDPQALERAVQGVTAVLLSLKKKPVIRYEKSSPMAKKLGVEIQHRIQTESQLFDFRLTQVPPLLLILDRRSDPVTPLLSQWTYQAMVHELLGIQNGRVDLNLVPDIRPELKEVTLTTTTDPFFQAHHLATFGDLGTALKSYVQSYQSHSLANNPSTIQSISDMKRFVEEYPEFRKLGGNVSKHVAIVGELSRLVERDKLLELGEVEQGLATGSGADLKNVQALITNPAIQPWNKLRLVMLYALRYQKSQAQNVASLINLMLENGVSREDARLVYVLLNIAGSDQRQEDLFSAEALFAKGRSALKGLKGVENVYMQHTPHLSQTLENLFKGRLRDTTHPFLDGAGPNAGLQRPGDVIIFMIGGTTYAEARVVALLNQEATSGGPSAAAGTRLLLGGTHVHNSSSFLDMVRAAAVNFPASVYEPPPGSSSNMPSLNLNLGGVNTMEDVKVKTRTGALLTIIAAAIILSFTTIEFFDYRHVNVDTSIVVDRSRGEKLTVNMNVTFPRVPCYLLSLDVMDISGETQADITHNILKTRLDERGVTVPNSVITELQNDLDRLNEQRQNGYCGSCYGGIEPESGCCNTCDEVRQAYVNRGWSFNRPDSIEQCVKEGWSEKLKEQAHEGCNISGRVRVNKVVGNIHLSPGRSFRTSAHNLYELVPYLRTDGNRHDFTHQIHHLAFEGDDEYDINKARLGKELKQKLGIAANPLDGTQGRTIKQQYMFQYFLKVVSTQFQTLDGKTVNTHQYSATHFERDLDKGPQENTPTGLHIAHGSTGIPGAFFNYEISPILIRHSETRQSFAHFLTSTCAIVGGVLTVASLIDSVLFATRKALKKHSGHSSPVNGSYTNGKLM
ncbi:Sec1-domain-containing protein [Lentinus tigrinus ALCF2SS1-7]|uniref:Sec1-domain-containing protein n=1 Tax=Lentinus tigrinus ALCF2SS1-6 TaxID=1328759 RepID=A0A5C2SG15_9APHY|nr:Sec1-domain-containing protein [Lentinus tigrinus ALCF2SS1-6]RPD77503.1 Sec1-domain-containing protein [Lentinus tigrinus ALCF2SS1-7]